MKIDFVPTRWWQVLDFIHVNFEMVRNRDPWADRVLSRPWALSSLLEYAYVLAKFPFSSTYSIVVSGERVGVLWLIRRKKLLYMLSFGLVSDFRTGNVGLLVARLLIRTRDFVEDYAARHNCEMLVLKIAADNQPSQRMAKLFRCRSLGLATTRLTLSTPSLSAPSPERVEIRKLRKSEAVKAWRRWKLYGVERVAGHIGVEVATNFFRSFYWIDALPQGKYLALFQDGQEIGFAFARQREGELDLGLFPSEAFFAGQQTAALAGALASYLKSPVHHLTLTQRHADALAVSAPFNYERHREEERLTLFQVQSSDLTTVPRNVAS